MKKKLLLLAIIITLFTFSFSNIYALKKYDNENVIYNASNSIKVTFNANGGSVRTKTKSVKIGSTFGTLPKPTRKGYKFKGWYLDKTYEDKITEEDEVEFEGNVTLYAKWSKTKYTITYELKGGTNSDDNPEYYYVTSTKTLYKPTRKGYTFNGWYTSSSYKTKITKITKGTTGNKTLYAKWTVNKYNIAYYGNGSTSGSVSKQTSLNYNKSYSLRSNGFKKKDYTFVGWNTKKDGSGTTYEEGQKVKSLSKVNGKTIKLYAIWKAKEKTYTIKYVLSKGTNNSKNPTSYTASTNLVLYPATRSGYSFGGWYLDSFYNTSYSSVSTSSLGNATLYAKWTSTEEKNTNYSITYVLNGGKNASENPSEYNETDGDLILSNPTKIGYEFLGWYSENTFKNKITKITGGSIGDKVLYAKWSTDIVLPSYSKTQNYDLYVISDSQVLYNKNDIKIGIYNYLNNRSSATTVLACDDSYISCMDDVSSLISGKVEVSVINDYVSPYYEFSTLTTSIYNNEGLFFFKTKKYKYSEEEIIYVDNKIEEIIDDLGINSINTQEGKIKKFHDYMIDHLMYDSTLSQESSTAYAALKTGKAICSGYTDLMSAFLDKIGIKNMRVSTFGKTDNEIGHTWNAVYLNNEWLHIDVTWDDVPGTTSSYYRYRYYLKTTDEIKDPSIDKGSDGKAHHNFKTSYYVEFA